MIIFVHEHSLYKEVADFFLIFFLLNPGPWMSPRTPFSTTFDDVQLRTSTKGNLLFKVRLMYTDLVT